MDVPTIEEVREMVDGPPERPRGLVGCAFVGLGLVLAFFGCWFAVVFVAVKGAAAIGRHL